MTTLYFIRHGETAYNLDKIRQGVRVDEYLNTTGIFQAEELAAIAGKLKLDVLVTSYLKRAEETAAIIEEKLKDKIPIVHEYRLRERDFGSLSGQPMETWNKLLPNHKELEDLQMYDYTKFGGENVEHVRKRVMSSLLDLAMNYQDKNIGVITHGGVIRLILFHFPDIPRIYHGVDGEKDISNADIYEWQITDGKINNIKSLLQ